MKAVARHGKRDVRVEHVPDAASRAGDRVATIRDVLSEIADAAGEPPPPLESARH